MGWFSRFLEHNCCGIRQSPPPNAVKPTTPRRTDFEAHGATEPEPEPKREVPKPKPSPKKPIRKGCLTTNTAFMFIKPGALTESVKDLVERKLRDAGISILEKGEMTGEEIEEKGLIDQHYYSIASKAMMLKPHELDIPKDSLEQCAFEKFASVDWETALALGWALNAADACDYIHITPEELDHLWHEAKQGATGWVKLANGFQCARILVDGKDPIFVFNGFYPAMRLQFFRPGPAIRWYSVEWNSGDLSWHDFREKLIGATDPAAASPGSLRRQILDDWKALGLATRPSIGENCVHASFSPFEALAERCNWRSSKICEDPFGQLLLNAGLSEEMIQAWRRDPEVAIPGSRHGSLFDQLESLDTDDCINTCLELKKLNA